MSISLQKGQKISLTKEAPGLNSVMIGLGWDAAETVKKGLFRVKSNSIDCDASAFMLKNGHINKKDDIVYFGNLHHYTDSVRHMGDNLTGDGDGDDEQIFIDLAKVPSSYNKIVFIVTIYQAIAKNQDFGMVKNAYIRLLDNNNGHEIMRYDLSSDYKCMHSVIFGELYRHGVEWKFNAIGSGCKEDSIGELSRFYQ